MLITKIEFCFALLVLDKVGSCRVVRMSFKEILLDYALRGIIIINPTM